MGALPSHEPARPRFPSARGEIFGALDALHPDLPDDARWVRCAVYTRQSVKRPGDDPAVTSCAIQRTLCTEFIRNKTWDFWYPIAERFDDEGESAATLERPGLAKLLRRVEEGDVRGVIVYRVDRLRVWSRSPTGSRGSRRDGFPSLARSRRCERLRIQVVGRFESGRSLGFALSRDESGTTLGVPGSQFIDAYERGHELASCGIIVHDCAPELGSGAAHHLLLVPAA